MTTIEDYINELLKKVEELEKINIKMEQKIKNCYRCTPKIGCNDVYEYYFEKPDKWSEDEECHY